MIETLEKIGFYTLSDDRVKNTSVSSDLQRCELILSSKCNFRCSYCRRVGGNDIPLSDAENIVRLWCSQNLKNIRFSGGEPTLYKGLDKLVSLAKKLGCEHIAISTNGSASKKIYDSLIDAGANDFSISLDACCASDGDIMAGVKGVWDKVVKNIRYLSSKTYVTVGCVLNDDNADKVDDIIRFADTLGVSDIRIIPAAQDGDRLKNVYVSPDLLEKYPILAYRIQNLKHGLTVRGLSKNDSSHCAIVLDDMAVCGKFHYPCIIYLREGGNPIGEVGDNIRIDRKKWFNEHNTQLDPICSKNCLDVCRDYSNKYDYYRLGVK